MSLRTERLKDIIREIASEEILTYSQNMEHNFGVISVTEAEISPDMSYSDVYVDAGSEKKDLPKFLTPLAHRIHVRMAKEIQMRKTPKIRFRLKKEKRSSADILSLINSLDKQYGLSEEHHS